MTIFEISVKFYTWYQVFDKIEWNLKKYTIRNLPKYFCSTGSYSESFISKNIDICWRGYITKFDEAGSRTFWEIFKFSKFSKNIFFWKMKILRSDYHTNWHSGTKKHNLSIYNCAHKCLKTDHKLIKILFKVVLIE